ncbi:MAG TPA: 30S ribosomal protein S20 [Gemmatimonadota bacterium]
MPNVKSAVKRVRTSANRRVRNRSDRSRLRTAVKQVRQATDPQTVEEIFRKAASLLDRAARKGLIHPNKAARDKSRLSRHARALGQRQSA